MAPRTRSKPGAKSAGSNAEPEPTKTLPPNDTKPRKLCILPKGTSPDARILTLANPATSSSSRYLFCPEKGIYEFTKLAAPRSSPRSWLIAPRRKPASRALQETNEDTNGGGQNNGKGLTEDVPEGSEQQNSSLSDSGYITSHADLLVATPVDPLFIILPALAPTSSKEKQMFLAIDDHLDKLTTNSSHIRYMLKHAGFKAALTSRMDAVCDIVDAGDEKMYRLSVEKLGHELLSKAERMAKNGLPASLEDKFVRRALEPPLISLRCNEPATAVPGSGKIAPTTGDSQSSTETTDTQTSTESQDSGVTAATSIYKDSPTDPESLPKVATAAPEGVPQLLRLRTAFKFISSSYVPASLRSKLDEVLKTSSRISFAPLDAHMGYVESLRKEAQALRSLSDNINRKRTLEDDEDAVAAREEKKRKKEEEELRKKNESRGVKALKKVDTKGMKKLSSFFAPKLQAKKA